MQEYQHFWFVKNPSQVARAMPRIVQDVKHLLPHLPPLAGPSGTGEPEFSLEKISFNGPIPNNAESFSFYPFLHRNERANEEFFSYCRTDKKPYDLAVTATLLVAYHHAYPALDLSTTAGVADWMPAYFLVRDRLGYDLPLFKALHYEPLMFRDGEGRVFFCERSTFLEDAEYEQVPPRDEQIANIIRYLERKHAEGVIPFTPPFSLEGVYNGPIDLYSGDLQEAGTPKV